KRCADMRRQVDLVDDEQVRASDARSAFAGNLVPSRDVDHVNGNIHQLRTERRRQVIAAALHEDQLQSGMAALEIRYRFKVHGSVFANSRMRATASLDPTYATRGQRPLADQ